MPSTTINVHRLVFKDSLFCKGLNMTVRRGAKRAGQIEVGDLLKLISSSGSYLGGAEVIGIMCMTYREIPEFLLSCSTCSTLTELDEYMAERYPDFDKEEYVTIIFFKVHEPEEGSY